MGNGFFQKDLVLPRKGKHEFVMPKFCWGSDDSKESAPLPHHQITPDGEESTGHMKCCGLWDRVGCDGGVPNGNAHHLARPGRAASGGEWPSALRTHT